MEFVCTICGAFVKSDKYTEHKETHENEIQLSQLQISKKIEQNKYKLLEIEGLKHDIEIAALRKQLKERQE